MFVYILFSLLFYKKSQFFVCLFVCLLLFFEGWGGEGVIDFIMYVFLAISF